MDTENPGDPARTEAPPTDRVGRIPADTFSNRLMLARALAGHVSVREAAEMTGLNRGAWDGWEHGRRPRDILDVCRRVADKLDVDFNWLLLGGPLAGPRGVPVRPPRDTLRYTALTVRATSSDPFGRPQVGVQAGGRRAVRVGLPRAA